MYFRKYFKNYLAQRKISGGKIIQDDVKFIYSEKATKFCETSTVDLTDTT